MGTDFCCKLDQGHENPLFRQFCLRNILVKYYQKTLRLSDGSSLPALLTIPTHLLHKMDSDKFSMSVSCTCSSVRVGLWGLLRVRDNQRRSVRVCQSVSSPWQWKSHLIIEHLDSETISEHFSKFWKLIFLEQGKYSKCGYYCYLPWSHLHLCKVSSW